MGRCSHRGPPILPSSFPLPHLSLPLLPPSANIAAVIRLLPLSHSLLLVCGRGEASRSRGSVTAIFLRLRGDPSNRGGGDNVCMCEMCTVCGKVCVCVWGAHTGEVTKGMMESCQSGEVQRRGKAIRGRGKRPCVCGAGGGATETAVENEKSWVYQTAFSSGCTSIKLMYTQSDCFHAPLGRTSCV